VVSVAEALELGADDVGVLAGRPLLAVDLDDAPHDAGDRLGALPCVVAGLATSPLARAPGLDVLLTTEPAAGPPWRSCPEGLEVALADLATGVEQAPRAATTLVQVLRAGRGRSLEDGLTIESLAYAMLQAGPEHQAWLAGHRAKGPKEPTHAEPVGLQRRGGTLTVTLRRPEVRNAVDVGIRDGLVEAFGLVASDPTIERVELRGEGPDFSAGGDLREFGTKPDPVTGHLVRSARSPARALARCADRATAYVHGASVGAGIELAALAVEIVATPDATFRLPELSLGLIPGAGGTATIPRRIGRELTAWMALTGASVDAETALRWGLIDHITQVASPL
jgi:enoyl-CoA hydratase/carnithine racemase